jgi:hypothetical protein
MRQGSHKIFTLSEQIHILKRDLIVLRFNLRHGHDYFHYELHVFNNNNLFSK